MILYSYISFNHCFSIISQFLFLTSTAHQLMIMKFVSRYVLELSNKIIGDRMRVSPDTVDNTPVVFVWSGAINHEDGVITVNYVDNLPQQTTFASDGPLYPSGLFRPVLFGMKFVKVVFNVVICVFGFFVIVIFIFRDNVSISRIFVIIWSYYRQHMVILSSVYCHSMVIL